jgi:hypothetical protein
MRGNLIEMSYEGGRWDEAVAQADEFLAEVDAGSPHYMASAVRSVRALIRVARDDVAGALLDDRVAVELARPLEDPQALHPALCRSAWTLIQAREEAEAAARADEMLALAQANLDETSISWHELAFALAALGRGYELVELAERDRRPSKWREAAREFARGELVAAADSFREIGTLPSEAYARLLAAERLVNEHRRPEADAQLGRALAFYRSVRATRYLREGENILAATA